MKRLRAPNMFGKDWIVFAINRMQEGTVIERRAMVRLNRAKELVFART